MTHQADTNDITVRYNFKKSTQKSQHKQIKWTVNIFLFICIYRNDKLLGNSNVCLHTAFKKSLKIPKG